MTVGIKRANINRLRKLGYDSIEHYLKSGRWSKVLAAYEASGRPRTCFGCGDREATIVHRSYSRLGAESLNDILPLCRRCRAIVAREIESDPSQCVQGTPAILRRHHRWTKEATRKRMVIFDAPDGLAPIT